MKKFTCLIIIACTFLAVCRGNEPMPPPAGLEAGQLKLSAAGLKAALPLLEARVTRGSYLERTGAITAGTLGILKRDYELARKAAPSDQVSSNKIYRPEVPLHRQSDAAVFTLGKERLTELQKQIRNKAEKSERNYQIGAVTYLAKLLDEADLLKINRVCGALDKPAIQLNDTLSPLPFFLQSAVSLSKLSDQELDILIKLERERLRMNKVMYEANSPFVKEAEANLERLETARNTK